MQGLMFRKKLGRDDGMLFIFEEPAYHSMWMKNTLVPLSVAFLDADGRILNILDMEPETLDTHTAAGPAIYAIETNKGWFAAHRVKAADKPPALPPPTHGPSPPPPPPRCEAGTKAAGLPPGGGGRWRPRRACRFLREHRRVEEVRRRHEEEHRDRQRRVGPRGEERDAARLVLLVVGRRNDAEDLLLVRPDQRPDVDQHDGAQPRADPDRHVGALLEAERLAA